MRYPNRDRLTGCPDGGCRNLQKPHVSLCDIWLKNQHEVDSESCVLRREKKRVPSQLRKGNLDPDYTFFPNRGLR